MPLFDNKDCFDKLNQTLPGALKKLAEPLILQPFSEDFSRRFCWSSNALEGNTLSLEETVAVLDYDEVQSGHSYTEYQEAKALHRSICRQLLPLGKRRIDEPWIQKANALLMSSDGGYRTKNIYIGTTLEAVFYPPDFSQVPEAMKKFIKGLVSGDEKSASLPDIFQHIAECHMEFERIHPFADGNGRTGRMILNQQILNYGLLPIAIEPKGSYRQAFRRYDRSGDLSQMIHSLCKSELDAVRRVEQLYEKMPK